MTGVIDDSRIRQLNTRGVQNGEYILYWMQSSVRTKYNFALDYAKQKAIDSDQPLVVYFGINTQYPESNQRHLKFMLQGLKETIDELNNENITTFLKITSPDTGAVETGKNASIIVTDRGYLRLHKKWREHVASKVKCPLIQVESDIIIPVEEASLKEEWSAATIRRKINQKIPLYLREYHSHKFEIKQYKKDFPENYFSSPDINEIISLPEINADVKPSEFFTGGYSFAKKTLLNFTLNKIASYSEFKNHPEKDCQSDISPYLHFGHISPLEIVIEIINSGYFTPDDYLEQLIIRRELAINYVTYNQNYDNFNGLPKWCINTLMEHKYDKKDFIYSIEEFEKANTHDKYWNAAQDEMRITGKMHGYMRMYWGKKIIEWSESPESAFKTAVYLNNKYSLDGRDPNSYAGIAWCFGKHDRPWKERPVFGKIRYMNNKGLERKFNMEKYVKKIKKINSEKVLLDLNE
ncbi:MAG: deoxyribodipyrimidine photo-lyase [Methanomicrobiaceae archaeon]|nr:deoxyribodipyrimidine photo-lyase [Methanomicrobiaceae archaeon]